MTIRVCSVCMQGFNPDLVVGISVYICTSMLSAKLGVPYVTVTPGKPDIARHLCLHHIASYHDPMCSRDTPRVWSIHNSLCVIASPLQA